MGERLGWTALAVALWVGNAEGRPGGRDAAALSRPIPDIGTVARRAMPGVVSITTIPKGESAGEDNSQRGLGSGFIITPDGHILTAAHVVEGSAEVLVSFSGRTGAQSTVPARLVGLDSLTDVALLKVDVGRRLPALRLATQDDVDVADWVIVIGNPFGLSHTVTVGIVSFKGRSEVTPAGRSSYLDFLQTDASINPGSSGGPVLDLRGRVVAIANAVNVSGQGIGFAVPIDIARTILPDLRAHGRVRRGWLGADIEDGDSAAGEGAQLSGVEPGGPAQSAGLLPGDRVLSVDGHRIGKARALQGVLALKREGDPVAFEVIRGGERRSIRLRLAREPTAPVVEPEDDAAQARAAVPCMGAAVTTVDPAAAEVAGLARAAGALIASVDPGTASALAGLQPGDVVLKVNTTEVDDPEGLLRALEGLPAGGWAHLFVRRGARTVTLTMARP